MKSTIELSDGIAMVIFPFNPSPPEIIETEEFGRIFGLDHEGELIECLSREIKKVLDGQCLN